MTYTAILVTAHEATNTKPARLSCTAEGFGTISKPLDGKLETRDAVIQLVQKFTDDLAWSDSHWIGGELSIGRWVFTRIPDTDRAYQMHDEKLRGLPDGMAGLVNSHGRYIAL